MSYKHFENCEGVICTGDPNPDYKKEVVWYAGETVCTQTPHTKFQQKQITINKELSKGTFKKVGECWNAFDLETRSI